MTWIRELVREEREAGVPARRIVLAGFSQGGAVALAAAGLDGVAGDPVEVGGVLALSTHVAHTELVRGPKLPGARLFAGHGLSDELIPCRYGEAAFRAFRDAGWDGVFRAYPIAHEVSAPECRDVGRFLAAVLGGPA